MAGQTFQRLGVHPANPDRIAIFKGWFGGPLFLSADGGTTWNIKAQLRSDPVDIAWSASSPENLFVSTGVRPQDDRELLHSRNGGDTWQNISQGGFYSGRLHLDGDYIYVARRAPAGGLYRSTFDPIAWEPVPIPHDQDLHAFSVFDVAGLPGSGTLFVATSAGLFQRHQAGAWDLLTDFPLDRLAPDPHDPARLWASAGRLGLVRISGSSVAAEPVDPSPQPFSLAPPFPNPAHEHLEVTVTAPASGPVTIEVYDLLGRMVARIRSGKDYNQVPLRVSWDLRAANGSRVPSGVYLVVARAGSERLVQRFTVIR